MWDASLASHTLGCAAASNDNSNGRSGQSDAQPLEGQFRVVCVSDTHGRHRELLPGAVAALAPDALIHAGDFTDAGRIADVTDFAEWLDAMSGLPVAAKVVVPGNHDLTSDPEFYAAAWRNWHPDLREPDQVARARLAKSATVLGSGGGMVRLGGPGGPQLYGCPAQPRQPKSRPQMAFGLTRGKELKRAWGRIPVCTDILVTHTPPFGTLDGAVVGTDSTTSGHPHFGCEELRKRISAVRPALHVFGHVHAGWGHHRTKHTVSVNASSVAGHENGNVDRLNPMIVVDLCRTPA